MFTRKQFFIISARHCLDFVRTCISPSFFNIEGPTETSNISSNESIFFEAMRSGIDPGTMSRSQLAQEIKLAKQQKEKGGGEPLKNTGQK